MRLVTLARKRGLPPALRLAAVVFGSVADAEDYSGRLAALCVKLRLPETFEFHFSKTGHRLKMEFFQTFATTPFFFVVSSIQKSTLLHEALNKHTIQRRAVGGLTKHLDITDCSNIRRWLSSSRNRTRLPGDQRCLLIALATFVLRAGGSVRGILGFATKLTLLRIGQFLLAAGFTATVRSAPTDKFPLYLCNSGDLLLLLLSNSVALYNLRSIGRGRQREMGNFLPLSPTASVHLNRPTVKSKPIQVVCCVRVASIVSVLTTHASVALWAIGMAGLAGRVAVRGLFPCFQDQPDYSP